MAGNQDCIVEVEGEIFTLPYSFPTSAKVMEVKQRIEQHYSISVWRQTMYLLGAPMAPKTKMENDRTLASYGIQAGQTARLMLEVEPARIRVMLDYVGYQRWLDGEFITCYETITVMGFKLLILDKLHTMGLLQIGPNDMVLHYRGRPLEDPGATLGFYGVRNERSITIMFLRNHPPAGTRL